MGSFYWQGLQERILFHRGQFYWQGLQELLTLETNQFQNVGTLRIIAYHGKYLVIRKS